MAELVDAGDVGAIGVSNFDRKVIERCGGDPARRLCSQSSTCSCWGPGSDPMVRRRARPCGGDTRIFLLTGTSSAGREDWPLASFATDRLEAVVDDLRAHGVPPEECSEGAFRTDERGIADMHGIRLAWIRDPDDQVISIFEPVA